MSQHLAHLCELLIEDTYGPLCSHLFSILNRHGRLSAREIARESHLPLHQVISGLAILTECLFVFHHTTPDERTWYQANVAMAFNIVRVGTFTQLMRRSFGPVGVKILQHLLVFGHDTLENLQNMTIRRGEHGVINGVQPDEHTVADYLRIHESVLEDLVEEGYLSELRPAQFQTAADTWRSAETVVKASGCLSAAKGKKGQQELEDAVQKLVGQMMHGEDDLNVNGKRAAADNAKVQDLKRLKRSNSSTHEQSVPTKSGKFMQLNGQSILRLNHARLIVSLKHQIMTNRARQKTGAQAGQVLASLLRQSTTSLPATEDFSQPPPSSAAHVDMNQLLLDVKNMAAGAEDHGHRQVNGNANGGSTYKTVLELERLDEIVATLAEGSCTFIIRNEANTGWEIDVQAAEDLLRDDEIMQMVKRRFGLISMRIVRILKTRGKVDEKALQEIGLLNAKELRRCLAQLHTHGFIDLQEVPREPQRQPARTIYLWFFDAERVKVRVLENLYKSMCRLLQRLMTEKQRVSSTLQKVERSDVKGKEHTMLRSDEIVVLEHWRRKELWYLSELERMGSSVDILGG